MRSETVQDMVDEPIPRTIRSHETIEESLRYDARECLCEKGIAMLEEPRGLTLQCSCTLCGLRYSGCTIRIYVDAIAPLCWI